MTIYEKLTTEYPELTLRVRSIVADKQKKRVSCVVAIRNRSEIADDVVKNVIASVKSTMPDGYHCEVKVVDDKLTENDFRNEVFGFIKSAYPVLTVIKKENVDVQQVGNNFNVTLHVDKGTKRTIDASDFVKDYNSFFDNFTCYTTTLNFVEDAVGTTSAGGIAEQERILELALSRETMKPSRYFRVTEVQQYVGKVINSSPMYIYDVRTPLRSCVICGKVSEKSIRPTQNPELQLCKFTLQDGSMGKIQCVLFVRFHPVDASVIKRDTGKSDIEIGTIVRTNTAYNDKLMKKLTFLGEGTEVIVRGKVAKNDYSGNLEMSVYDICKCKIAERTSEYVRPLPAFYNILNIETFSQYVQESFTDKIENISYLLKDKTYVVLNANVTGYNAIADKVFSVSGVKIANGKITEHFFTYLNPDVQVASKLLEDACCDMSKLLLSHTLTEVIGEIRKFCDGAILVGLDVNKLIPIFNYYAEPAGYSFDNEVVLFNNLVSNLYENSPLSTKPNCANLTDVCKSCHVSYRGSNLSKDVSLAEAKCIVYLSSLG